MKKFLLCLLLCFSASAQIANPPIDPQVVGWIDDSTSQGTISTRPSQYNLVPRAIRAGNGTGMDFFQYAGSGVTWSPSFRALKQGNYSGHSMSLTVAGASAATNFNYAKISFNCYGRRVGVRWYNVSGQSTNAFNVIIDGTPYLVDVVNRDPVTQLQSGPDPFFSWVVPDQLDDTRHSVEIVFTASNTSGVNRSWILWDVLLDASAGYLPQRPMDNLYGPQTATTSYASFGPSSPWDATDVRVLKIVAVNTTASAATISVATSASDSNRFIQKSVAAGDTYTFDLGQNGAGFAPLYIKSDTGSAILVWVQANTL